MDIEISSDKVLALLGSYFISCTCLDYFLLEAVQEVELKSLIFK